MVAPQSPDVSQASSSSQVARVVRFAAFTQHSRKRALITIRARINYRATMDDDRATLYTALPLLIAEVRALANSPLHRAARSDKIELITN